MRGSPLVMACCLFIAVLLTRAPLLGLGFGTDPDAWRVVRTAETLAESGVYVPSRFPGYPLTEFVYAGLFDVGLTHVALWNGLTAALSALAAVHFYFIYRTDPRRPAPFLAALTMSLVPTLYFESASTMDYLWALAFITGSTLAILRRHPAMAGALLGLAIAARLTSAAFIVPAALLICSEGGHARLDRPRRRALLLYAMAAALTSLPFYAPLVAAHGLAFLSFIDTYPDLLTILHTASLKTFGVLGSIACGVLLIKAGLHVATRPRSAIRALTATPLTLPSLIYIAIVLLVFLRLPHEPGYLIPLVPFVLIAIADLASGRTATAAFAAFALSPFLIDAEREGIALAGPVVREYETRMTHRHITCSGVSVAAGLPTGHYLLMGQFQPFVDVALRHDPASRDRVLYAVSRRSEAGYEIYEGPVLPDGVRFHVLAPILPQLRRRDFYVDQTFIVEPVRLCRRGA